MGEGAKVRVELGGGKPHLNSTVPPTGVPEINTGAGTSNVRDVGKIKGKKIVNKKQDIPIHNDGLHLSS